MNLKYIPCMLFLMILALSPLSRANIVIYSSVATASAVALDDFDSKSKKDTLARDNSRILTTSGMSTMFAIWNTRPAKYCGSKLLFNSRHNRIPCKLRKINT